MRWIIIVVSVVFVAAVLVFAIQNFQKRHGGLPEHADGAPLAVLVIVIYLLGMVTGGSVWTLIRRAIEESKRPAVR